MLTLAAQEGIGVVWRRGCPHRHYAFTNGYCVWCVFGVCLVCVVCVRGVRGNLALPLAALDSTLPCPPPQPLLLRPRLLGSQKKQRVGSVTGGAWGKKEDRSHTHLQNVIVKPCTVHRSHLFCSVLFCSVLFCSVVQAMRATRNNKVHHPAEETWIHFSRQKTTTRNTFLKLSRAKRIALGNAEQQLFLRCTDLRQHYRAATADSSFSATNKDKVKDKVKDKDKEEDKDKVKDKDKEEDKDKDKEEDKDKDKEEDKDKEDEEWEWRALQQMDPLALCDVREHLETIHRLRTELFELIRTFHWEQQHFEHFEQYMAVINPSTAQQMPLDRASPDTVASLLFEAPSTTSSSSSTSSTRMAHLPAEHHDREHHEEDEPDHENAEEHVQHHRADPAEDSADSEDDGDDDDNDDEDYVDEDDEDDEEDR